MTLFKNKYRIESARLPGWDYSSPGFYFITVCAYKRVHLFGHVIDGEMRLNEFGKIIYDEWYRSFEIRRELLPDEFVIMPNHFHGVVRLVGGIVEAPGRAPLQTGRAPLQTDQPTHAAVSILRPQSISSFMGGAKSVMTSKINQLRQTPGKHALQLRFHDHVIRNERELLRIRNYIRNNPVNWKNDKFYEYGQIR